MNSPIVWGIIAVVVVALLVATWFIAIAYRKNIVETKIGRAESQAREIIDEAQKTAEAKKREILLEAKEDSLKTRNDLEKEVKDRRGELSRMEKRILAREENLDKKTEAVEKKEASLANKESALDKQKAKVEELQAKRLQELERISGLTSEQAKEYLLKTVEDEVKHETAVMVKELETRAKEEANKKAKEYVVNAIQRCAVDHISETTISLVQLPNDEMKGRLIGREGRNIRAIENATGVELIIDDTPEVVILSGFDPVRRQIARITIEKLIGDGRIHPARIEEMVEKVKRDMEITIKDAGEQASFDTGVFGLHPELIKLLGRLKYRTSYGQNVLAHSVEVSYIAGIMASELGLDVALAKRAALLHDIGKAVDQEVEGTHMQIGADLAKKYKESKEVVNAIAAHHGDVEAQTIVASLVQAADAISAARPGARRENLETYIKRLQNLEEIANSFDSVEKSFAIQAGREIRIMVKPEKVNDEGMILVAKEIVKRIESELEYPGQIKVSMIRETRAVDYAK